MKYKFVRFKFKEGERKYVKCGVYEQIIKEHLTPWFFEPKSEAQIIEFWLKHTLRIKDEYTEKMLTQIEKAKSKGLDKLTYIGSESMLYGGHPSTTWECANQIFSNLYLRNSKEEYEKTGKETNYEFAPSMYNLMALEMLKTRLELFDKGITQYFDKDAMTSRCLKFPEYECTHEIELDALEFPKEKPIFNDVQILKWPGGMHYYAKIYGEDIVVDGCQKWFTKTKAENAAKKYIEENFKEKYG